MVLVIPSVACFAASVSFHVQREVAGTFQTLVPVRPVARAATGMTVLAVVRAWVLARARIDTPSTTLVQILYNVKSKDKLFKTLKLI